MSLNDSWHDIASDLNFALATEVDYDADTFHRFFVLALRAGCEIDWLWGED